MFLKCCLFCLMRRGNRTEMHERMHTVIRLLKNKFKRKQPLHVIFLAVNNLRPPFEIGS